MQNNFKKGLLFAILAAVISGFSIFYNKLVLVKGIDSLIFNILKNGGVAILFTLFLLSNQQSRLDLKKTLTKDWLKLLLIGVIGGSIPFFLFFEGLKHTSALNATLIQKSLFVWVALLAIPLLGEKLSIWQAAGFGLLIFGNLFIGGFKGFLGNTAEMMIFTATLFWTVEVILVKKFMNGAAYMILAWGRMFFGTLLLVLFAVFTHKIQLLTKVTSSQLMSIAGSVVFLSFYVGFWYKSLKLAPATVVTSVLVLATPITNILTAVFITHSLVTFPVTNLLATIVGVLGISLFTRNDILNKVKNES